MLRVRVDTKEFVKEATRLVGTKYPKAVASGFIELTKKGQRYGQAITKQKFRLNTEWVPNQIKIWPDSLNGNAKLQKDIRSGDWFTSIFTSKHLSWFLKHEYGLDRTPSTGSIPWTKGSDKGQQLAIPVNSEGKKYLTRTGAVRSRYQPLNMLKGSKNPWVKGSKHPGERGNGQRLPFILKNRKGEAFIARRNSRARNGLEIFYEFKSNAKIKAKWGLEDRVHSYVMQNYKSILNKHLYRMAKYNQY